MFLASSYETFSMSTLQTFLYLLYSLTSSLNVVNNERLPAGAYLLLFLLPNLAPDSADHAILNILLQKCKAGLKSKQTFSLRMIGYSTYGCIHDIRSSSRKFEKA